MSLLPKTITAPVGRLGAAAQNALEVARFGGLTTDDEPSPYEVTDERSVFRLRRYYPGANGDASAASPMLLVPPLMVTAEIYDVSPETSAVGTRTSSGVDPWVIDFGAPEHERGGLERTLDDHVLAVAEAWAGCVRRPDATSTWPATRRAGCSPTRPPPTAATTDSHR